MNQRRSSKPSGTAATRARVRDPERTRARILTAATREFASKGYSGARVEAICRAARANPRMIYHYFTDKDGLYVAVLERVLGQLREEELKLDVGQMPPMAGVLELFNFIDQHFGLHPELLNLLSGENLLRGRFLSRSTQTPVVASPLIELLGQVLKRGERAKVFRRGVDPLQLYVKLVALAYFHRSNAFTLSSIFRTDLNAPRWQARYREDSETMLRLFLGAHKTRAPERRSASKRKLRSQR